MSKAINLLERRLDTVYQVVNGLVQIQSAYLVSDMIIVVVQNSICGFYLAVKNQKRQASTKSVFELMIAVNSEFSTKYSDVVNHIQAILAHVSKQLHYYVFI